MSKNKVMISGQPFFIEFRIRKKEYISANIHANPPVIQYQNGNMMTGINSLRYLTAT
jgi:hypothetical protein